MNVAGLRASLRIARRDALRAKGRSVLVIAMIGLPMFGLAFADVAVRTGQLPPNETAARELGAADAVVEHVSDEPIEQSGLTNYAPIGKGAEGAEGAVGAGTMGEPASVPDLRTLLPAGSRFVPRRTFYAVRLTGEGRALTGEVEHVDLADPMSRGLVRLRSGAFPASRGEAAVTPSVARKLGIGVGGTVVVPDADVTLRVTGIVVTPSSVGSLKLFVPPDQPVPDRVGLAGTAVRRWAVTLPEGVPDVDLVPAMNARGFRVLPRSWFLDPPPNEFDGYAATAETVGLTVVVVGLATLEIVLLAGTAFAVGARRKRRELALVAATGGDRGDVRRVVLAGAVVLGTTAGVVAVAGGVAAVALLRPVLDRLSGSIQGPLDVRPLELGAIVAIGAGTALLAALLPARTASRQPVVAALTGRRGDVRTRRGLPVLALAAVVAGAVLAFWAAGEGPVPAADGIPERYGRSANFPLLLTGAVLAELGFVACAPGLVGLVGRLASRLPLSLRLAARDAARHRTRSGPAVAAVVAAVAGSVAVSVYISSDTERQRRAYEPQLPMGTVWINAEHSENPLTETDLDAAVAALPARERIDVSDVAQACGTGSRCRTWMPELPAAFACPEPSTVDCFRRGPRHGQLMVASPSLVTWITGRADDRVAAAVRRGAVVVFDERWLQDGALVLRETTHDPQGGSQDSRTVRLPGVVASPTDYSGAPVAVIPPDVARRHDLPMHPSLTLVTTTRLPTQREEATAFGLLTRTATYAGLHVERGFRPGNPYALLALAAAAAVVTVGATGIATGLAAADSRPDLATLAAVGAAPRVRRRLAMAQAATVAALGSGLGILAGLVPSVAVVAARAAVPLALPWTVLGVVAVGVPVLAALLVGAVTRSRLPLERRIA